MIKRFALLSRSFAPALVALVSLGSSSAYAVDPQDVPAKAADSKTEAAAGTGAEVSAMDKLAKGKDAKGRHSHKKHHKHHKHTADTAKSDTTKTPDVK
jgi:hypothetical protein